MSCVIAKASVDTVATAPQVPSLDILYWNVSVKALPAVCVYDIVVAGLPLTTVAVPLTGCVIISRVYGLGVVSFATTLIVVVPPFDIPVTESSTNTGSWSL